ncbi:predicted protein [Nematostella vectensis]|uniref:Uncharacterized protein n=1 Tax=Nematostella vectensis TaxID=45351 RepID=A7SKU6_NEMVE|nr:mucin-22 [Nematostella vectensis]EDO35700.1 predicted protein [Nematostella vectensis]|eukprot:XP_001627800.1 predicted protein [Nematostella vectensis]
MDRLTITIAVCVTFSAVLNLPSFSSPIQGHVMLRRDSVLENNSTQNSTVNNSSISCNGTKEECNETANSTTFLTSNASHVNLTKLCAGNSSGVLILCNGTLLNLTQRCENGSLLNETIVCVGNISANDTGASNITDDIVAQNATNTSPNATTNATVNSTLSPSHSLSQSASLGTPSLVQNPDNTVSSVLAISPAQSASSVIQASSSTSAVVASSSAVIMTNAPKITTTEQLATTTAAETTPTTTTSASTTTATTTKATTTSVSTTTATTKEEESTTTAETTTVTATKPLSSEETSTMLPTTAPTPKPDTEVKTEAKVTEQSSEAGATMPSPNNANEKNVKFFYVNVLIPVSIGVIGALLIAFFVLLYKTCRRRKLKKVRYFGKAKDKQSMYMDRMNLLSNSSDEE